MVQDSVLWKSRRYRGYRAPEIVESTEFEEISDSVFTYDSNGNVQTLTKTRVLPEGVAQTKIYTFTYDALNNVQTITQVLSPLPEA